jgi:hypothetical protein
MELTDKDIEQLHTYLEKMSGDNFNPSLAEQLALEDQKLISCRHEIVINVIANVLEENDQGEKIGSKSICRKNYHIPVPANKDYNEYMSAFFDHMEKCMTSSANESDINTKEIQDG